MSGSNSLSGSLPETLTSLRTQPLFVLRETVPPLYVVGATPNAFRRIGVVVGGSFAGERATTGRTSAATIAPSSTYASSSRQRTVR